MNHINLDIQGEAIKQFFIALSGHANGTILESKGLAIACVVPLPAANQQVSEWTSAMNGRRWELITKKHSDEPLTPSETAEFVQLQEAMLQYRRQIAPLPLQDAQQLHDELLRQVADTQDKI